MNNEQCEAMRELVSALFDDELADREREAAQAHLERCAACRGWLAQVRAAQQRLQSYPRIEAAPGFNEAVMARVTAGPLTRLADALDRLICTPARQVAAGMLGAVVLAAIILWSLVLPPPNISADETQRMLRAAVSDLGGVPPSAVDPAALIAELQQNRGWLVPPGSTDADNGG